MLWSCFQKALFFFIKLLDGTYYLDNYYVFLHELIEIDLFENWQFQKAINPLYLSLIDEIAYSNEFITINSYIS